MEDVLSTWDVKEPAMKLFVMVTRLSRLVLVNKINISFGEK